MLILMLFSLNTTGFGGYDSQLGNLLAVYLTYGQFNIVFNENVIDSKSLSIADKMNFIGVLINVIQYISIV